MRKRYFTPHYKHFAPFTRASLIQRQFQVIIYDPKIIFFNTATPNGAVLAMMVRIPAITTFYHFSSYLIKEMFLLMKKMTSIEVYCFAYPVLVGAFAGSDSVLDDWRRR